MCKSAEKIIEGIVGQFAKRGPVWGEFKVHGANPRPWQLSGHVWQTWPLRWGLGVPSPAGIEACHG